MRSVSDKICKENKNTHFVFSNFFFENRTVYEIMWKNIVQRGMPQMDNMAQAHLHAGYLRPHMHTQGPLISN
jgi:hypothetical protein